MEIQKLIPQFYYDLISRVLPSGVAFIGFSRALGETPGSALTDLFEGAGALKGSAFFLTLSLILTSYLLGHLIAPLSYLFEKYAPSCRGLKLGVLGIVLSGVLVIWVGQVVSASFEGLAVVDAWLPVTAMALLVLLVVLGASALPARRAAGIDPIAALRCE